MPSSVMSPSRIITILSLVALCILSFTVLFGVHTLTQDTLAHDSLFSSPKSNVVHHRRGLHHARASTPVSVSQSNSPESNPTPSSQPAPSTAANTQASSSPVSSPSPSSQAPDSSSAPPSASPSTSTSPATSSAPHSSSSSSSSSPSPSSSSLSSDTQASSSHGVTRYARCLLQYRYTMVDNPLVLLSGPYPALQTIQRQRLSIPRSLHPDIPF